jgi:hypothetical protein
LANCPTQALRAAPVTTPPDDRTPAAIAYQWASRIMVVALEMVLPGLAGHWLDVQLGTVVLFLLIGLGLGCTAAIYHLIQMTRSDTKSKLSKRTDS